jgi:hypothetical protein
VQETCLEANYLVVNGCACEEEDFNIYLGGLPLEAAADTLNATPHAPELRDRPETAACLAALAAAADGLEAPSSSSAATASLAARLRLRHDLVRALSRLRGKRATDLAAAAEALQAVVAQHIPAARRAAATSEGQDDKDDDEGALGFDPQLNSHLTPPSPPRQLKVCSCCVVLGARARAWGGRDPFFFYADRRFSRRPPKNQNTDAFGRRGL